MNQAWARDRETAGNAKGAKKQRIRKGGVPLCCFARFVALWFKPHLSGPCGMTAGKMPVGA
ncbi:MAG: hypothetical protein JWP27_2357 [Flaviaesturariibacter sp.]|nr:hypothetical protein [Flaviaesturariibacter sp.]